MGRAGDHSEMAQRRHRALVATISSGSRPIFLCSTCTVVTLRAALELESFGEDREANRR